MELRDQPVNCIFLLDCNFIQILYVYKNCQMIEKAYQNNRQWEGLGFKAFYEIIMSRFYGSISLSDLIFITSFCFNWVCSSLLNLILKKIWINLSSLVKNTKTCLSCCSCHSRGTFGLFAEESGQGNASDWTRRPCERSSRPESFRQGCRWVLSVHVSSWICVFWTCAVFAEVDTSLSCKISILDPARPSSPSANASSQPNNQTLKGHNPWGARPLPPETLKCNILKGENRIFFLHFIQSTCRCGSLLAFRAFVSVLSRVHTVSLFAIISQSWRRTEEVSGLGRGQRQRQVQQQQRKCYVSVSCSIHFSWGISKIWHRSLIQFHSTTTENVNHKNQLYASGLDTNQLDSSNSSAATFVSVVSILHVLWVFSL